MPAYDDAVFHIKQRKWFGLTPKHGGEGVFPTLAGTPTTRTIGNAGGVFTFGTTDATSIVHVKRWYPQYGIRFKKFGYHVIATLGPGSTGVTDRVPLRLLTRGASASVGATLSIDLDGTLVAQYSKGSIQTFAVTQCKKGEYISIKTGTPQTAASASAANTATSSGTVAFFLDYVPIVATDALNI